MDSNTRRFFRMTGDAERVRSLSLGQLVRIVEIGSSDKEWIEYLREEISRRRIGKANTARSQ